MLYDLSTWFAYPALLGLLALLPGLWLLMAQARRRRRQAMMAFGQYGALQKLQPPASAWAPWRTFCLFLGLGLLGVGAAGPRWGRSSQTASQDSAPALVLVLDVSRSMLAEQPSRQELARRALRDLAATLAEHGGPRVALVIFAAHAQLAFPLTRDYDHLVDALRRIDADDLPPPLRPRGDDGATSGTRIGAALRLAVQALEPDTGGDILLLSDGDDPARDEEWREGAEEARRHNISVHTVGIGNPALASTIPFAGGVLEFAGQPVKTRLDEKPLQEIARTTHGTYIPAHTGKTLLGRLLPSILARRPETTPAGQEKAVPLAQPRYAWVLTPALLFLAMNLLIGEGRLRKNRNPLLGRVLVVPLMAALLSAAPLPSVDVFLRKGAAAFERGQSQEALHLFEQAEAFAPDPGLVAFNKAAALYRLERFGEAALHYQRCLEDASIPARRRSQALFQMGHAYLRESQGTRRDLLEKALDAYRACLLMDETAAEVRADARHNLELARLLWLRTLSDPENPPRGDDPPAPKKPKSPPKDDPGKGTKDVKVDDPDGKEIPDGGKGDTMGKSKKALAGPLTVLPDHNELVALSPQETAAHLEDITQRISQERRAYRRHAVARPEGVKDW